MNHFFYSDGQSQFGPFSKEELQSKDITPETLVWYEGLEEWTKADEADELVDLFPKVPTPPPLPKMITPPPIPKEHTISAQEQNLVDLKSEKESLKRTSIIVSIILICVAILAIIIGVSNS